MSTKPLILTIAEKVKIYDVIHLACDPQFCQAGPKGARSDFNRRPALFYSARLSSAVPLGGRAVFSFAPGSVSPARETRAVPGSMGTS